MKKSLVSFIRSVLKNWSGKIKEWIYVGKVRLRGQFWKGAVLVLFTTCFSFWFWPLAEANRFSWSTLPTWPIGKKEIFQWLDLLLVPVGLALIAILFNWSQNDNERRNSLDQEQERALQNYLDVMSTLLVEKKLRTTEEDVILKLARSRTLTILRSLNNRFQDKRHRGRNRRKGSLARFLYETELIFKDKPVIGLRKANLEYAFLRSGEFFRADFSGAFMEGADCRKANFREANLEKVYLPFARLQDADFSEANLQGANLKNANLSRTKFINANLKGANLEGVLLHDTVFDGATMPDGSVMGDKEKVFERNKFRKRR